MEIHDILNKIDHTILSQTATWSEVKKVLDEAELYKTASVCIPPSMVKRAKAYKGNAVPICTVIGFPNGYQCNRVKAFECENAVADGADELDVVIDLGDLKDGNDRKIQADLKLLKEICGERVLKVIVETCYLTREEKIRACEIVTNSGADFIKTSTGFGTAGAVSADIVLFSEHVGKNVKIKAAGGISSLSFAEELIKLGASRLGSSKIIKLVQEERK